MSSLAQVLLAQIEHDALMVDAFHARSSGNILLAKKLEEAAKHIISEVEEQPTKESKDVNDSATTTSCN